MRSMVVLHCSVVGIVKHSLFFSALKYCNHISTPPSLSSIKKRISFLLYIQFLCYIRLSPSTIRGILRFLPKSSFKGWDPLYLLIWGISARSSEVNFMEYIFEIAHIWSHKLIFRFWPFAIYKQIEMHLLHKWEKNCMLIKHDF